MPLKDKLITDYEMDTFGVVASPDRLTGTARENKSVFDRLVRTLVARNLNPVLEELAGYAGAEVIGAQVPGITGNSVYLVLAALKAMVDQRYTKAETDALLGRSVNDLVREISFQPETGIFTIVKRDGTTQRIDTALEKVALDARLEGDDFVLRLADGTEQRVNLAAFIDTYAFSPSGTVAFQVDGSGNSKRVTAHVKEHSITLPMLNLEAVSKIQGDADRAVQSAGAASASAGEASRSAALAAEQAARAERQGRLASDSAAASAVSAGDAMTAKGHAASSEYKAKLSELGAKVSETASADALTNIRAGLAGKLSVAEANQLIKNIYLDSATGVFTFVRYDGSVFEIDTALEKMIVNFQYDALAGDLVLAVDNGSEIRVPLTGLIDDYTGGETNTAWVTVNDKNRIFAHIRGGSISLSLLDPALQGAIHGKVNANEPNNASLIKFSDGQSMQEKLNSGAFRGKDGISAPVSGFYSLYTTPAGDLVLAANEELEACPFRLDGEGNLIYTVGEPGKQ